MGRIAGVGVDVGYLFSKVVAVDASGEVVYASYVRHEGRVGKVLRDQLHSLEEALDAPVVLSGQETKRWQQEGGAGWIHEAQALSLAVRHVSPWVRVVLHVGATGVSLLELDEEGNLASYGTNTLCAAGTGSFLDEQAARLGVSYERPVEVRDGEEVPLIATRCTVFAKSDLIHRQQEGFSKEAMWAGLCRGMTSTLFQTLLKGRDLPGRTVVTGGVSLNPFVLKYARERFPGLVEPMPGGHVAVAHGAALHASCGSALPWVGAFLERLEQEERPRACHGPARPALLLERSSFPSFAVQEELVDAQDNEIRVDFPPGMGRTDVFVGVDVGSTSTKLAVLDEDGKVLCDIYRRTAGEPIEAGRKLMRALAAVCCQRGLEPVVRGLATTGSGRKLVGMVFGADVIINEITAHATGALASADGEIETIFEIGGQDAKYIRVQRGQIRDSNMNFVCSAGTGSFVEEQARKLGYRVQEVGAVTEGIAPPATSDRCTVFMEQDVAKLLSDGHSRSEAMGAVLYSVVKNYLNKVVGNRPVSRSRVVFQGATARNRGLVAAFENLLGVEVVVSPYCHVMGCIGAALVARDRRREHSGFVGFDNIERPVEIGHSRCELCSNSCRITQAVVGGLPGPSWGYMCGRDPDGPALPVKFDRGFRILETMSRNVVRQANAKALDTMPVIGLPESLSTTGLLPFWAGFLGELKLRIKLDGPTDAHVKEMGAALAAADFCFPVKAHLGHVKRCLADPEVDHVLVPFFISDRPNDKTSQALVCPYVESSPGVVRCVVGGDAASRLVSPILDFRWSDDKQADELFRSFSDVIPGLTGREVRRALDAARQSYLEFYSTAVEKGRQLLADLRREGRKAIVFVGRPYNVRDQGLNLAIPKLFAQHNCHVIPHELLPFKPESLGPEFRNVFWAYGQKVLSALRQVGEDDLLYAVYLSNFSCGPDSFLLTYAEEVMKDKPFLVLELDEHGSEGGYQTRIEAFLDVLAVTGRSRSMRSIRRLDAPGEEFRRRTIWLPPMHPVTVHLFAAAFRAHGYDARPIPLETQGAFERGRSVTRGSECLPTCSTIGAFLTLMKERELDPGKQAFFMATASGPCRFGQYELLHRMALDREGYPEIPIMSPSSLNSYQGLGEGVRHLAWKAVLVADMLFKARCKVAPYELEPGAAERALWQGVDELSVAIERKDRLDGPFHRAMERFSGIRVRNERKPLVGIVGEIYVRCNPFTNDFLVQAVERYGGEAWLAPVSEWFLYTTQNQAWSSGEGLNGLAFRGLSVLKNRFMIGEEKKWYAAAGTLLADRHEPPMAEILTEGKKFIPLNFEGEAIITVGRAILFAKQGASMVVNAAPFGCMPGTLTTAILRRVQEEAGIPMVGMFYDGTPGINRTLEAFLGSKADPSLKGFATSWHPLRGYTG